MNSRNALGWLSALALGTALVGFGCSTSSTSGHADAPTGGPTVDSGTGGPKADASTGGPKADGGGGPSSAASLGMACTGPGTCPAGYVCLNLQGGTGPWCSIMCTSATDPVCSTGYTGPGQPGCILNVQPPSGSSFHACAVICKDMTAGGDAGVPPFCDSSTCDGTCPGSLACTAPLKAGTTQVATACQ